MEEMITKLSLNLASFCNDLESSCNALQQSVDRRPIPLDSASTTFIQSLNRRVSSLTIDLNVLETMSFGTVSFEELLGNCNEVYRKNEAELHQLQQRLQPFGYSYFSTGVDGYEEEDILASSISTPSCLNSHILNDEDASGPPASSYEESIIKKLEDSSLFEDSLSLQNLGLSDVCLATIASEGDQKMDELNIQLNAAKPEGTKGQGQHAEHQTDGGAEAELCEASKSMITVSEDDYKDLPSYMKSLASWEDLQIATERLNSSLTERGKSKESNCFHPDEIVSMGLGHKARSYLLLLVKMKRLLIETKDGLITYRVL